MTFGLKEALDAMSYEDLMNIKMDLERGGLSVRKMVVQKVREKERLHESKCAVCSSEIDIYSTSNYTLLFGPEDFKKKASFCAMDCMEYFFGQMREIKGYKKSPIKEPSQNIGHDSH